MSQGTMDSGLATCLACGSRLGDDPQDEPHGGAEGRPLCGACARARDEETDLAMMDLQDGRLDGIIDW